MPYLVITKQKQGPAGPAGSNVPIAAIIIAATLSLASPALNQVYAVQSTTADIAVTVTGTPVDGTVLTFCDVSRNWTTRPFTFNCQAGATAQNPENVAAAFASSFTCSGLNGESFSIKWVAALSSWIVV